MGATALGMNSPVLLRHVFDVVIVDEAGQLTLPATIAPLLKARAFVLVRGKSSSARLGMKWSLWIQVLQALDAAGD